MRVTIGIPFYNAKHTLADAIRSVFAQTFQDWELILADDGSTDGSAEIARMVDDPRVTVISDGMNRGLPYRLNKITELARADYIARMDADDLMHPERLTLQVQYLDANPAVDVVSTATYTIDAANQPLGIRGLGVLDTSPKAVLKRGLAIHPTITGRSKWFHDHPYDDAFPRAEDHELWCRTCQHPGFAKFRQPLYFYREGYAVNIDNYLQSCKTDRKIFKAYGPSMVGWHSTIALIAKSHAKGKLYRALTSVGMQHILVGMRNDDLQDSERETALRIIKDILETNVPGLITHQPIKG